MTKEFKRTFFSSSIAVLLIISNLLSLKYTNFASFVLPVSFITYPLISLCVIMLVDLYGRKTAKQSISTACILQLLILIIYLLATKLSNQSTISDYSVEINTIFNINIVHIVTSLGVYLALCYVTINLFESFKLRNQRSIGSLICMFIFTLLYGAIYLLVTNYKEGYEVLLKLLSTHIISSFFMTMICYGIYYVFRENFDLSDNETVSVKDKSVNTMFDEEKIDVPKDTIKAKRGRKTKEKVTKTPKKVKKTGQVKEKK